MTWSWCTQKDHGREGGGGKMQNERARATEFGHSTIAELPTPKWPRPRVIHVIHAEWFQLTKDIKQQIRVQS